MTAELFYSEIAFCARITVIKTRESVVEETKSVLGVNLNRYLLSLDLNSYYRPSVHVRAFYLFIYLLI